MQKIGLMLTLIVLATSCNHSRIIEPSENLISKIENKCDSQAVRCLNSFWVYNCEIEFNKCMDEMENIK